MDGARAWESDEIFTLPRELENDRYWQVPQSANVVVTHSQRNEPHKGTDEYQSSLALSKSFTPALVRTLMSERHLRDCGVRTFEHDTDLWLVPLDADTLVAERPSAAWLPAVVDRIDELRALALDEALAFSDESARHALDFAGELKATRRPGVFLIANGNIRLLWNKGPEQIGLQFMGDGTVQYVMFSRRGERVMTHMGDDEPNGILRQITAAGLRHLMND